MPSYTYRCKDCGHTFEEVHSVVNRKVPEGQPCPSCKHQACVEQIIVSGAAVTYGTGNLSTPDWFKERLNKLNKESGTSHAPIKG